MVSTAYTHEYIEFLESTSNSPSHTWEGMSDVVGKTAGISQSIRDYFTDDLAQLPQKLRRRAFKISSLEEMEVSSS